MQSTIKIEVDHDSKPFIHLKAIESEDVRDALVRNFHQSIFSAEPKEPYYNPEGLCLVEFGRLSIDGFTIKITPLNYVDITHPRVQRILDAAIKNCEHYQNVVKTDN